MTANEPPSSRREGERPDGRFLKVLLLGAILAACTLTKVVVDVFEVVIEGIPG